MLIEFIVIIIVSIDIPIGISGLYSGMRPSRGRKGSWNGIGIGTETVVIVVTLL